MRYVHFLILAVILVISGCGANVASSAAEGSDGLKTYDGGKVSFKYPENWKQPDKSDLPAVAQQSEVMFGDFSGSGKFASNVNVVIQESPGLAPSATIQADQTDNMMKSMGATLGISDYKRLGFTERVYGEKFKAGVLTAEFTLSQTGDKVASIQYYVPIGAKTYIMTLSFDKESFDAKKYDTLIEKMVGSFTVKG